MKRLQWFGLAGLAALGIAAFFAVQVVRGQPEAQETMPLLPLPGGAAPDEPADLPVLPPGAMPQLDAPPGAAAPRDSAIKPPDGFVVQTHGNDAAVPQIGPSALPPANERPPRFRTDPDAPPAAPASGPLASKDLLALDVAPGKQQPAVSIEWVAPNLVRVNQPINCQIIVRNTATVSAQNVLVRHRLSQGVLCKSSEPAAAREGGDLLWHLGNLAPGQTRRVDVTLVAPARATLSFPATVTFSAVAAHRVQVQEPKLALKMRGPDKAIVGENVTLLVAISNPGDGLAELVKVKAILPDGLEHPRGKVVEFDVGNLAPKEIRTMQVSCLAKGSGMQKCAIHASAEGDLKASDAAQFEILMPKLDVALSGPKLRYLDRHAVYTLQVTNPGSAPATQVEVQELIPSGFKFQEANHNGRYQDATRLVTWSLSELGAGKSITLAVNLIPVEIGEHRLIAHAKAARGLTSQAEARTLVEGLSSLSIEASHVDDPIEVGAETAFEIKVANTGTKTETNIEVVCTLPEQLEFRGASCGTALRYRREGRDLIFEPLPRLAPRADMIYRVQVKGIAAGDVRFRTQVRADHQKDPVLREESLRIYRDDMPIRTTTGAPVSPAPTRVTPATTIPAPAVELPSPRVSPGPLPTAPMLPPPTGDLRPLNAPVAPPPLPAVPSGRPLLPAPAQFNR